MVALLTKPFHLAHNDVDDDYDDVFMGLKLEDADDVMKLWVLSKTKPFLFSSR